MQHPSRATLDAAPFFDIERDAAVAMAPRMAATIDERWRTRCGAAGMSPGEVEVYEPAFDHHENRIARQMGRGR
ncbi:MAG: hypothetical protein OXG04_20000 [Acidobacteria bacterium]|nr:hypothetical protein [Acidobacteriota bacterium]